MDTLIGMGLIGAGGWGALHARVFAEHSGVRLAAVCDADSEKARKLAAKYGADACADHRELLTRDDIAAVSIVTPDFAHTQIALDAAAAGKHILVEKPLATTTAECRQIINAAHQAGVKLMVDFHNRWSPPFYRAKASIQKGDIGSVRLVYYRLSDTIFVPTDMLSWASKSTVMWFIGSHSLDTVMWLLDDEVTHVYAVSRRQVLKQMGIDTPDFYEVVLEFAGGAVAVVENCWILPRSAPNIIDLKCEIIGSQGAIYVDGSHHRMLEKYTAEGGAYPDVLVLPEVQGAQKGFAADSIRHFIDCLAEDRGPIVTGEDGLRVTRLIEAVEQAVASGQRVELTPHAQ